MSKKAIKRRIPVSWKDKFHKVKIIGPTPEFNKEGYWKKHKQEDLEIEEYRPKK